MTLLIESRRQLEQNNFSKSLVHADVEYIRPHEAQNFTIESAIGRFSQMLCE